MLRTIFMVGLLAIGGLFLLKAFFGLFGGLFALLLFLLSLAVRVAIVGLLVYVVIRIFSPETARKMRDKFSGRAY